MKSVYECDVVHECMRVWDVTEFGLFAVSFLTANGIWNGILLVGRQKTAVCGALLTAEPRQSSGITAFTFAQRATKPPALISVTAVVSMT